MKDLENLVILIGKNGSGKSNVLEALDLFFLGMPESIAATDATVPNDVWSRQATRSKLTIEVEMQFDKGEITFSPTVAKNIPWLGEEISRIVICRELERLPKKTGKFALMNVDYSDVIKDGSIIPIDGVKATSQSDAVKILLQKIRENIKERYKSIGLNRLVSPSGNAPAQRKAAIPRDVIQGIIQLENSAEPIHDMGSYELENRFTQLSGGQELTSTGSSLMIREGRNRIPLHLSGAGTQTMLGIVYHLIGLEGLLTIEEPEVHLHAGLQRRIAQELKDSSEKAQIIITTHSTIFIDEIRGSSIWYLVRDRGATKTKRIEELDELKEVTIALGVRPSDVLMANNVLFVEGPTDAIVLSSWAELMDKNFRVPRISIVPMRGASKGKYHLELWDELAKNAGIPRFMLLDGDKPGRKEADEILSKGQISSQNLYILRRRNIEDYYNDELLREAIDKHFSISVDFNNDIENAIKSDDRVNAIRSLLRRIYPDEKIRWKGRIAEYIADNSRVEHLEQEIRNLILKIDDILD